jgi:hypothetical protein
MGCLVCATLATKDRNRKDRDHSGQQSAHLIRTFGNRVCNPGVAVTNRLLTAAGISFESYQACDVRAVVQVADCLTVHLVAVAF